MVNDYGKAWRSWLYGYTLGRAQLVPGMGASGLEDEVRKDMSQDPP